MSYCSSPLFFCFSVLSLYSLVSSSLPLSVRLPCFQNNLSSSLKQSPASFSLFGYLLQVRFLNFLPPLVSFFSFPPLFFVFSLLCIYSQAERESPLPCSIKTREGNEATLPLQGKVAGCLQGMGCINGGRVKRIACVWVLWASGRGKRRRIAGKKDLKSSSSLPLHVQGRRRTVSLKRHYFSFFF